MRGLSAVVRPDDLGIAKASKVGWAAGESHAFLYSNLDYQQIKVIMNKISYRTVPVWKDEAAQPLSSMFITEKSRINARLLLLAFLPLVLLSLCGCSKIRNPYFDEEGYSKEKLDAFKPEKPESVKFYVEVSGSMNGFFRSNQATKFKHDLWSIITDTTNFKSQVNVFAGQDGDAMQMPLGAFREGMNKGSFVSGASTDIPDMISRMLDDVDSTKSELGVLVSDMKYDPTGNSSIKALLDQYSTDIRNIMVRHAHASVCLMAANSEFLDKNGCVLSNDATYYYLIVGAPSNVVYMRNYIASLLRLNHSFVDEIEWGIDYEAPSLAVCNADYLTVIDLNKSYSEFKDDCTITLSLDITNFPWALEDKDYLKSHLKISSTNDAKCQIMDEGEHTIEYDTTYVEGMELKRTAIVKVPVHISDMYDDYDVFEISMDSLDVQRPNSLFLQFMNAKDVGDVDATSSMRSLLQGLNSSMKRSQKSHVVHLLIKK